MKILTLLLTILVCNFSYATKMQISSTPENSEVFFQLTPSSKKVKLGKTPLSIVENDIEKLLGENKTYILKIEKRGFEPYQILMLKSKGVETKLEVSLAVNQEIKTAIKHDNLASSLFDVQRLIRSNNYSDAHKKLDSLEQKYRNFSIIPELKGLAYYMQKDINNALSMFRLAFSRNSENKDAYKMKVYLEKKLGIDTEVN